MNKPNKKKNKGVSDVVKLKRDNAAIEKLNKTAARRKAEFLARRDAEYAAWNRDNGVADVVRFDRNGNKVTVRGTVCGAFCARTRM